MITAIILARASSTRYPNKHFARIGNKRVIDLVIENLKKNKLINHIILATGTKKKNFIFSNLKKKYKNFEIYYHKNENDVTERINFITKNIKTEFSLLVSGDCCLIDNSFINRMYYRLKNSDFDFIKPRKKIIHEGLTLFRTNIWKKVFQLTKKKYQKEHPGYVVKEYSKKFNIKTYLPKKYEKEKKFRISVDTKSDFDFFNYLHNLLKRKKRKFNLINVIKIKKKNVLNKHVFQRVANPKKIPNIIIITTFSKSLGLGHMARSKVLLREIQETTQSIPKIFLLNSARSDDVMLKKNVFYIKKISRNLLKYADKVIIDLPEKVLSKEKKKLPDNSKIIIVDNYYKEFKKINFIIPSIKKYSIKKNNIYSGNDYLILSRDINYQNSINDKLLYKKLLILSGSNNIDKKTYDLISKNKNIKILLGSLIKKKEYKKIKKITKNVILNPNNLFQIIKQSKIIYCKFGITALEVIALGKKPIIIDHFRNNQTVIDVNYLIKNNLVSPIDFKCHLTKKNNLKIDINKSLKNVMKLIVK